MICDLSQFVAPENDTGLTICQARNSDDVQDFVSVLEPYDPTARTLYERLPPKLLNSQERLFVGYRERKPLAIGILFEGGAASGIFSILTSEEASGQGYGTAMMKHLLHFTRSRGARYATLSASSDSGYRIYERLGFERLGEIECFEFKGYA